MAGLDDFGRDGGGDGRGLGESTLSGRAVRGGGDVRVGDRCATGSS